MNMKERLDEFVNFYAEEYPEFIPVLKIGFMVGAEQLINNYNEKCRKLDIKPRPEQIQVMLECIREVREIGKELDTDY